MFRINKTPASKYVEAFVFIAFLCFIAFLTEWRETPNLFEKNSFNSDDRMFERDYYDRSSIIDIFSPTKLTSNQGTNCHYMPMVSIGFNIIYYLSDGNPKSFVLVNFFIHCLNTLLLFLLLYNLVKEKIALIIGCSFFFLHKSQFLTIGWITALLSHGQLVFFMLTSLLFYKIYFETEKKIYYFLSIFFASLSCMTKPISAGIVLCYPLFDLVYHTQFCSPKLKLRFFDLVANLIQRFLPLFLVLMAVMYIEVVKYPMSNVSRHWGGVSLGIHPFLRSADLVMSMLPFESTPIGLTLVSLTVLVITGYFFKHKYMLGLLGIAWLFIGIFVMLSSNFREIESLYRYHYVPLVGLAIVVTVLIERIIGRFRKFNIIL